MKVNGHPRGQANRKLSAVSLLGVRDGDLGAAFEPDYVMGISLDSIGRDVPPNSCCLEFGPSMHRDRPFVLRTKAPVVPLH